MLSIDPVKLALYAFLALALGIAGTLGYRAIFDRGVASQVSVTKGVQKELDELKAELKAANAQATQKAQEAAQMARAIEDEQRRRIEEVEAMVASYNALADLDRSNYDKRLRNALAARACRGDAPDPGRMPEAASSEPRPAETAGLVSGPLSGNLGEFINGDVEGLNKQFHICYAAAYSGREISR